MMNCADQLRPLKILPVITIHREQDILPLCRALVKGGAKGIEITLRSDVGLNAIYIVKQALPEVKVAAGTITTTEHLTAAYEAGADFAVSPGISIPLILRANELQIPFLPGVATASEVMLGMQHGMTCFKLFPAVAVGGHSLLKSWHAPLKQALFCPTGGIDEHSVADYLALPNVLCVGGSWMVPSSSVEQQDWERIARITADSMSLA